MRRPGGTGAWRAAVRPILAFSLEVALLFAVARGAVHIFADHALPASLAAAAAAAVLWGWFCAPRSRHRLPWPLLSYVGAAAFLAGAVVLVIGGLPLAGSLMAAAAVVNLAVDLRAGEPAATGLRSGVGRAANRRRRARRSAKR